MHSEEKQPGVYGSNLPVEDTKEREGIRERTTQHAEQGNDEAFNAVRQEAANENETHGGMGRQETPRDGESQGEWHQEDKVGADSPNI
jgi:hypothetical protein